MGASIMVVVVVVLVLAGLLGVASGHGSMSNPFSRVYGCYLQGPESPTSAACQAAVALGGTQPFYDWNEVNIPNAAGRHRELIPDGQLCSAGREKYQGLDLARGDWPGTPLFRGKNFTFLFMATAAHAGYFEFYITRDIYDPTEPLKWSDLDHSPFLNITDPPLLSTGNYQMNGTTPIGSKYGRHLIYVIWQRSDSPEAFYSCSDIDFPAFIQHSTT